jgi:SWIM zinc finger
VRLEKRSQHTTLDLSSSSFAAHPAATISSAPGILSHKTQQGLVDAIICLLPLQMNRLFDLHTYGNHAEAPSDAQDDLPEPDYDGYSHNKPETEDDDDDMLDSDDNDEGEGTEDEDSDDNQSNGRDGQEDDNNNNNADANNNKDDMNDNAGNDNTDNDENTDGKDNKTAQGDSKRSVYRKSFDRTNNVLAVEKEKDFAIYPSTMFAHLKPGHIFANDKEMLNEVLKLSYEQDRAFTICKLCVDMESNQRLYSVQCNTFRSRKNVKKKPTSKTPSQRPYIDPMQRCRWRFNCSPVHVNSKQWIISTCNPVHTCTDDQQRVRLDPEKNPMLTAKPEEREAYENEDKTLTDLDIDNRLARHLKRPDSLKLRLPLGVYTYPLYKHIGEYFMIESFMQWVKESDPTGTFYITHQESPLGVDSGGPLEPSESRQFLQTYVALSCMKHVWTSKGRMDVVAVGSHPLTNPLFQASMLYAIAWDGNNYPILLAFSMVEAQCDTMRWLYFLDRFLADYEDIKVVIGGFEEGLDSTEVQTKLKQAGCRFSRCLRSMIEECDGYCKTQEDAHLITGEEEDLIWSMARTPYKREHKELIVRFYELNPVASQWFYERRHEYATFMFLNEGVARFEKLSREPIDDVIKAFEHLQIHSIIQLHHRLIMWAILAKMSRKRAYRQIYYSDQRLTPHVVFANEWLEQKHPKMEVILDSREYFYTYRATVRYEDKYGGLHALKVMIDNESFKTTCECQFQRENKRPCAHIRAVLKDQDLLPDHHKWYSPVCLLKHVLHVYEVANPYFDYTGHLSVAKLVPPRPTVMPAPSKKRKPTKSAFLRTCMKCGGLGHIQVTCEHPDLLYIWNKYVDDALKWATSKASKRITYFKDLPEDKELIMSDSDDDSVQL